MRLSILISEMTLGVLIGACALNRTNTVIQALTQKCARKRRYRFVNPYFTLMSVSYIVWRNASFLDAVKSRSEIKNK